MLKRAKLSFLLLLLLASAIAGVFGMSRPAYAENDLAGFTDKKVLEDANASAYANLMNNCLQKAISHSQSVSSANLSDGNWFEGMSGGKDAYTVGRYTDADDGKLSCDDDSVNVAKQFVTLSGFSSNTRAACELGFRPKDHTDYTVDECVNSLNGSASFILTNDTYNKSVLQGGTPRGENATGGYTYNNAQRYVLYKYTLDNYCKATPVALVDGNTNEDLGAKTQVTLVNQQGETYKVYYDIGDGGHAEPIIFGEDDYKCSDLPGKMESVVADYAKWIDGTDPPASDNAGSGPRAGTTDGDKQPTSCDSTYTHGIGWIVCPITNFLAAGMDKLFSILTNFLVVQPTTTDLANPLYRAWSFMRNLANVLFVLGFLIIIYSQITSFGLSSYGVKRMLPRLVIAAIFVNVSYWLTALAIDLSNILGFAFQQMFVSMRNSLVIPGVTSETWQVVSWEKVSGAILSGGALAIGVGGAVAGSLVMAGIGASIMLLLPILMGVILSALVAILVLAARQALITILVIVSPLACVAYILPNTEKYFERWRELFGTLLLVFPIFSVVFGGSQLAGTAIILNAPDNSNGINVILLGMAVQVMPLAITPLLIKVSGNLLGRFAGIVNNPNKGMIDKTRNFANERAALASARRLGDTNPDGTFKHNWPATTLARRIKYGKIDRTGKQKAFESNLEAGYSLTDASHSTEMVEKIAHDRKQLGTNQANLMYSRHKNENRGLRNLEMDSRGYELEAGNETKLTNKTWEDMKGGDTSQYTTPEDLAVVALRHRLRETSSIDKALDSGIVSAKYVQTRNFAEDVQDDQDILNLAAGTDPNGRTRARAAAISTITRERAELVKNIGESSDVLPGQIDELKNEFRSAVAAGNSEKMRAYAETMTAAGNKGVTALREIIIDTEATMNQHPDAKNYLRYFIDSNPTLNTSAEDIVSWSRNATDDLATVSSRAGTWAGLSPVQFASQKQSSQSIALASGGVSRTTAMRVLQSEAVRDLKPDIYSDLKVAAGYPPTWNPGDPVPPGWTP